MRCAGCGNPLTQNEIKYLDGTCNECEMTCGYHHFTKEEMEFIDNRPLPPVRYIQQLGRALRPVKESFSPYCRPEWINNYLGWCSSRSIKNSEANCYIGLYLQDVEELRKSTFLEF